MSEMSTREINKIIGMTLERLKQARKERACLNHKAEELAQDLETVAKVLRGEVKGDCPSGYFIVELSKGPKRIDWPLPQDIHDILNERERLETEIARLEEEARQMGHSI